MLWVRNKENNFPIHTLIWEPGTGTYIYAKSIFVGAVLLMYGCIKIKTTTAKIELLFPFSILPRHLDYVLILILDIQGVQ